MPGLVEHGEDVLVQDRLLARRADHQHRVQEGHQQPGGAQARSEREWVYVTSNFTVAKDDSFIHNSSH